MKNKLPERRNRYFKLSSAIAQIDNDGLHALLGDSEAEAGWGRNHVIEVARTKVFVKRVPMTALESANLFSTRNLYEMPTYYNYGVGSAGFGVFRELVTHIKTTNWVLAGAIETFPLLYHYRIIPATAKKADVDLDRHKGYVEYWNSSAAIGQYMLDRANAPYEVVLFLEHFPHTLEPWLLENPEKLPSIVAALRATTAFLRKNGVIHFDLHFENVLTDGERPYLSDFGLALDKSFALSKAEAAFFQKHRDYDDGELLLSVGFMLALFYNQLADDKKQSLAQKYGFDAAAKLDVLAPILLNHIEEIHALGLMKLAKSYVASIVKYRSIILLKQDFYVNMRNNKKKDTQFPHTKLRRLLKETGFLGKG